jgi:photosystem II stability/assembly factor-like uncharacterized protein
MIESFRFYVCTHSRNFKSACPQNNWDTLATSFRFSAKLDFQNWGPRLLKFAQRLTCCFPLYALFLLRLTVAQTVSPELFNALKWRMIGPFRGGRVVAVAGVPGDSTTFYFGGVDGGIWKTTDAGTVWIPISDSQPIASIGALAVAPSDPNTIYAGTGESDIRSSLSFGNGVYRSVDAGRTWTQVGLDDTRHISRIVVDPHDANIVYVGALGHVYAPNEERGVYKSIDGGTHWTKVLNQGPEIGISDLAICSGNPRLLFAGTWNTWRPPWSTYAPIDRPGGGIFRSQDAGNTWTKLSGHGLPEGDWGRIGIDVASDGRRVYALIQAKKPGLYRSDDGGDNWTLVNADARLTSRGWYFNSLTIDPSNPDVLYVPNVALYRSEDGGKTISIVRGAPGGDDYHQLWVEPKNSSSMVLGTDQGTSISLDRGRTWSTWYNQPTAQLYHVATDNRFPYTVYGTQQDSGSAAVLSRTDHGQITPRDWFPTGPSESGYMALDPTNPDIIYLSSAYGGVERFNRRTTLSQDVSPLPIPVFETPMEKRKYRAPWSPVLIFSPADPRALFFGTQFLMKTVDGGLHWQSISPDLTGAAQISGNAKPQGPPTFDNAKQRGFGVVSSIAPSALNSNLIWVGSDTGLIHVTRDGGKNWKDVPPKGLSNWSAVSLIEASHFDPAVAYAAVNRSRLDDQAPYIYRTRDYGATWHPITNGIAAPAFLRAVREDPRRRGLLFAGTEVGVYVSFDDGDHWQSLQLNLPVCSVRDLAIHDDDLVIATHGRSFWILDNISPLRQLGRLPKATSVLLYRPATAIRVDNDDFVGTPLPPEEPTADNPPNGAMIDYFLASSAKEVKLEILDAQQKLVRRFSSGDQEIRKHTAIPIAERWFPKPQTLGRNAGMHRFVWDLKWGSSGAPDPEEEAAFSNPSGPKVIPGTYEIRLTVDGQVQKQKLQTTMDPRSPATLQELVQQQRLGNEMFAESLEARRALAEINSVQKAITDLQNKAELSAELRPVLAKAQSELSQILTKKNSDSPAEVGLQQAYNNLAAVLQVVEGGDRTVPSQALAVYHESTPEIRARIAEWTNFKQTSLPQLNQRLHDAGVSTITISEIEQEVEFLMSR